MGARKNGRARGRHARGEGVPAQKAPENRFTPPIQLLGSAAWSQIFWQKTDITSRAETHICGKFCNMSVDSGGVLQAKSNRGPKQKEGNPPSPLACLLRARPFFLAPIYFLAPATQAKYLLTVANNNTSKIIAKCINLQKCSKREKD